ncbi:MAG: GTP-binding protein [Cyanobacteria bacterium J06632_22]
MTAEAPLEVTEQTGATAESLSVRARDSLRRAIDRYIPQLKLNPLSNEDLKRQAAVKAGIDQLNGLMAKLDSTLIRVAVFGLVSRGKSAVLNALVGEKILETGPLNGVTQWPRSIYWQPAVQDGQSDEPLKVELIDTPGLDEIEGAERGNVAQAVARQADLILFVVAGDITKTEYRALCELYTTRKPLILVFNKTDLYPDVDRQAIYNNLQSLWEQLPSGESADAPTQRPMESRVVDKIAMVAAEPAPLLVRTEWPDGRVTEEYEMPPANIDDLKTLLLDLIQTEGPTLIALNALYQAGRLETQIATATTELHETDADALIWRYAKYKAAAVALNPIAIFDVLGGVASDLMMIRNLAKLYGLPMTGHQANKLWGTIVRSSGTLILGELGSSLILGLGKSGAALWSLFDSASGFTAYAGAVSAQAAAAGYGTYIVGQVARSYLEAGCSWGEQGINTLMQQILSEAKTDSTLARLKDEIRDTVQPESEAQSAPYSTTASE